MTLADYSCKTKRPSSLTGAVFWVLWACTQCWPLKEDSSSFWPWNPEVTSPGAPGWHVQDQQRERDTATAHCTNRGCSEVPSGTKDLVVPLCAIPPKPMQESAVLAFLSSARSSPSCSLSYFTCCRVEHHNFQRQMGNWGLASLSTNSLHPNPQKHRDQPHP